MLQQRLTRLQKLKEQKEALQLEMQMQPNAPQVPEALPQFRGKDPDTVVAVARQAAADYEALLRNVKNPSPVLTAVGVGIMALGAVLVFAGLLIPGVAVAAVGLALMITGLALSSSQNRQGHDRGVGQTGRARSPPGP